MTPPTCAVGRWELKIDVIDKGESTMTVYRYNDKGRIYILFNPWCKGKKINGQTEIGIYSSTPYSGYLSVNYITKSSYMYNRNVMLTVQL